MKGEFYIKVICISGKAEHGKDTFASLMAETLKKKGKRVLITHYADLVKYICRTFFGWDGQKDEEGRRLLQYVGTDVVRAQSPDYWVNFIVGILTMFKDQWDYVLVPDTRFPNECELMKHYGFDTTVVRVVRPNHQSRLTAKQLAHPSETALDDYEFDYVVKNTTMWMLEAQAGELAEALEAAHE